MVGFLGAGPSRWSRLLRVLSVVYVFVLSGFVVFAGLFFVNFVVSDGVQMRITGHEPFVLEPDENFTYRMAVVYPSGSGWVWRVGVLEGDIHYYDLPRPTSGSTIWRVVTISAELRANKSFTAWTYVYYPDGHNETYQHEGAIGTVLIDTQDTQAGTYTIEIRNVGLQEMNAAIEHDFEAEVFEKPYFYYGVDALVVAVVGPVLLVLLVLTGQRWVRLKKWLMSSPGPSTSEPEVPEPEP